MDRNFATSSNGWVWGGGFEYAVTNQWTVKGEYLRVSFDDVGTLTQSYFGSSNTSSINLDVHIVRAGVNYKF
jgi:outer membrane immunogenic protein